MMILFGSIFAAIYLLATYYVGLRWWQAIPAMWSGAVPYLFFVYLAAIWSPFIARAGKLPVPAWLREKLALIADYYLAAFYYMLLLWGLVDALRTVAGGILDFSIITPTAAGVVILIVVASALLYGAYNAKVTRVTQYDLHIAKRCMGRNSLRAVFVSDVHLGTTVNRGRLTKLVGEIRSLAPEIVFLGGDIIDGHAAPFTEQKMADILRGLKPPLGVYAVMGNHEYLGREGEQLANCLVQAGVTVLRDQAVMIEGFYLAGREDHLAFRFTGKPRKILPEILGGVEKEKPVILLDHQPWDLGDAERSGVDLQLSGHTHHGQFFPTNWITSLLFEKDWGYLRKSNLQVVVSCGYATWGPPIRIGSVAEIVLLNLSFGAKATGEAST